MFNCQTKMVDFVTVAILARDKAWCLREYLRCIEKLDYPKDRLILYIRTNNNSDETASILETWISECGDQYAKVHYDASDVVLETKYVTLGKIRQESILYAIKHDSHYFVVDCDNFLLDETTLSEMANVRLPVVAPMLGRYDHAFANYHHCVSDNGYYLDSPQYTWIRNYEIEGIFKVSVVNATYFISNDCLADAKYMDGSKRHEYVIFSETMRKMRNFQYIDNRKMYGYLCASKTRKEFEESRLYTLVQAYLSR